jgi:hypothetical protein
MFNKGTRTIGGNVPAEEAQRISALLNEFADAIADRVQVTRIRRAVVRAMLPCSLAVVLDSREVFVAAQKQMGMPTTLMYDFRGRVCSSQDILDAAKWEFGFDDPFVIAFPADILGQSKEVRAPVVQAIAFAHVQSEINRVERQMSVIQINPIFGPASYTLNPQLAFVLMPFAEALTQIYTTFIKPTVEDPKFGLVCHRADDVKSNRAIIQDIWKSICEARLIVADLSGLNPNVMYELGMAHTLGKETILIYQRSAEIKFPFDLTHMRRIEYDNNAVGGQKLKEDLARTIENVLASAVRAP